MAPMSCAIVLVLFRVQLGSSNPVQTSLPSADC
jgi:hypothetical protein